MRRNVGEPTGESCAPVRADELSALRTSLQDASEPERVPILQRFFKTGPGQYGGGDRFRGIRVPMLRRLGRVYRTLALSDISLLLDSPYHEDRLIALLILVEQYRAGDHRMRAAIFEMYLGRRDCVNNWDLVDASAEHIVGAHLSDSERAPLLDLAESERMWDRRIAVMATFHFIKKNDFQTTLVVAERLLHDHEDLIHKAIGWMLREIGKRDGATERAFIDRHRAEMPRTMLRYAIERFPPVERQAYLQRSPRE